MTNQNNVHINMEELIKRMYARGTCAAHQTTEKWRTALSVIMGMPFAILGFTIGLFRIAVQFLLLAFFRTIFMIIRMVLTAFDIVGTTVVVLGWAIYVHFREMIGNLIFHLKNFNNNNEYGPRRRRIKRLLWPKLADSSDVNLIGEKINELNEKLETKREEIKHRRQECSGQVTEL